MIFDNANTSVLRDKTKLCELWASLCLVSGDTIAGHLLMSLSSMESDFCCAKRAQELLPQWEEVSQLSSVLTKGAAEAGRVI